MGQTQSAGGYDDNIVKEICAYEDIFDIYGVTAIQKRKEMCILLIGNAREYFNRHVHDSRLYEEAI